MEALYATHDELSHLLGRYKQSLRTEYAPISEVWSSFLDATEILFALNRFIRTGLWQAYLAASTKMLPLYFVYDHRDFRR